MTLTSWSTAGNNLPRFDFSQPFRAYHPLTRFRIIASFSSAFPFFASNSARFPFFLTIWNAARARNPFETVGSCSGFRGRSIVETISNLIFQCHVVSWEKVSSVSSCKNRIVLLSLGEYEYRELYDDIEFLNWTSVDILDCFRLYLFKGCILKSEWF